MNYKNIFSCFVFNYNSNPDKIFITDKFGKHSYEEIMKQIIKIIFILKNKNISKIAIQTSNSFYFISAFLACNAVNISSIILPQKANQFEINEIKKKFSNLSYLITSDKNNDIFNEINSSDKIILDKIKIDKNLNFNNEITQLSSYTTNLPESEMDKTALIQFSSGTTGGYKNINRSNRSLIEEADSIINTLNITENDKIMTILPLSYSFSFGSAFIASLFSNAGLYLFENLFPSQIFDLLIKNKITLFLSIPFFYSLMIESKYLKKKIDLSFIRYLISSGSKLKNSLQKKFFKKYNKRISNQYGSTETGALFINLIGSDSSLGEPFHNLKYEIDVKSKELLISGRTFSHNSPKIDQNTGIFNSGDLVKIRKNKLFFKNRRDKVININSEKISPAELENILENLNYVKLAKINNKKTNRIIAKVIIDTDKNINEIKKDLKKITMDYKIPDKIIIKKQK